MSAALDVYESFICGHEGRVAKAQLVPKGVDDSKLSTVSCFVLKPDGEFFPENFPKIGPDTKKGDQEPRRVNILRYLLALFPRAEIRGSGGTESSFHVIVSVDDSVKGLFRESPETFKNLLGQLRLISFCDKLNDGILSALSARAVGSENSKTHALVTQVQPASGAYSLEELERVCAEWFDNPEGVILRHWFGLGQERKARCPIHDSNDADLTIAERDGRSVAFCHGANHCAAGEKAAVIRMVARDDASPSLARCLLTDSRYRTRWEKAFRHCALEIQHATKHAEVKRIAGSAEKPLINIIATTTDDQILAQVANGLSSCSNLYCDSVGALTTLEKNRADGHIELQRHDSIDRFISLVGRTTLVCESTERGARFKPLPTNRAVSIFYRPELRASIPVLLRVSANPVLDLGTLSVQAPGYDSTTRVFYDGPAVSVREDGQTPILDRLLSGWTGLCSPFRSCRADVDIANLYGAVFTEVLADSGLFTLHRHPLIRGNQKGVGKDKLLEILGVLRDGATPVDLNHFDENRINQGYGNGIYEGRRIFQVTNISSAKYSNPMATRWLTTETLRGPKHGGGDWMISPNTTTICFTVNQGAIDNDLLDRLIPVNLEVVGDARKRPFAFSPTDFVREHRMEIIAEVLGLALLCLREKRVWKIPHGFDRRFARWMEMIGALLEYRGLAGFMSNLSDVCEEIDDDREEFVELARRVFRAKGGARLRAREILAFCRASGASAASKPLFQRVISGGSPERALSQYVLARFVNETVRLPVEGEQAAVAVALRREDDKKSKVFVYSFEPLCRRGTGENPGGDSGGDTMCIPAKNETLTPNVSQKSSTTAQFGGDDGDRRGSEIGASPPRKMLSQQDVTAIGGDGGDKSIEGSVETQKEGNDLTAFASVENPPGTIPAISATQSAIRKPTEIQGCDPWEAATL